jgi:DNA-directed RNA polymerase specialized sigma24 family protein
MTHHASAAPGYLELLVACRTDGALPPGAQRERAASQLRALLYTAAVRSGVPPHDADDVAQDALIQVLTTPLAAWRHPGAIVPTIARRRILDRMRRLRRERSRLAALPEEGARAPRDCA